MKKQFKKNSFKGWWPLKQLSALGSILSAATHQNWTKFKSCGHFDLSFHCMKKPWPLKAMKAKKGHLTFCWGSKTYEKVILFLKNMQFSLKQNLSMVEYEGVYFTSAWPFWPLKAKIFSPKYLFL